MANTIQHQPEGLRDIIRSESIPEVVVLEPFRLMDSYVFISGDFATSYGLRALQAHGFLCIHIW
jgi:hypothetical protein